ncbi:MAG: hypothetical protein ACR2RV_21500 [Verrucomicrobiales bacterium]
MPRLPIVLWLVLGAFSTAAERALERREAGERIEIRIEDESWGGARVADLEAVYRSACSEIAVHLEQSGTSDLEPIRIRNDQSGPIVLYERSLRGELVMLLNAKGRHWSQHAYQFAHEFCHILCRFKAGERSNLWFEESLCEMASIYALRQMAVTWETDAPYPNWRGYSQSLGSYAEDLVQKFSLPENQRFDRWFQDTQSKLRSDPTQRELNGIVAVELLPLFEEAPEAWQTLRYLNIGRGQDELEFGDYLDAWERYSPRKLQPLVARIAKKFGH